MAWKFLSIGNANAELHRLYKEAAALGHPQADVPKSGEFITLRIGKANAEIQRLTDLVATFKPPVIGQSNPGTPAAVAHPYRDVSPICGAGVPGSPSRFQVLSALELFPAVEVTGAESDEDLRAMLKAASGEAGLRLPGEPAEPTPGELRQRKLTEILAASPVTAVAGWNHESLAALVDTVAGKGTAKAVTTQPLLCEVGENSLAAQLNRLVVGSNQWHEVAAKMRLQARKGISASASPTEHKRQFEALRSFVARAGWRVPGLSLAGLSVRVDPEAAARPRDLANAQAMIETFCAVLNGDEEAGRCNHPAAECARKFIVATNRAPFQIGMVLGEKTAAEPVPIKGIYGGIPKSGI